MMNIPFAYYNQYLNGIEIAFMDNTMLFLSCSVAEDGFAISRNSQRLIDNLAIEDPVEYAALALDCKLHDWACETDEDWCPY